MLLAGPFFNNGEAGDSLLVYDAALRDFSAERSHEQQGNITHAHAHILYLLRESWQWGKHFATKRHMKKKGNEEDEVVKCDWRRCGKCYAHRNLDMYICKGK